MQNPAPHKYGARRIALNVRVKMAEKGFRNAASLHRALIAMGCDISHRQLLRIIDNSGDSLSKDVLDALLNLFDCSPAELFTEVLPGQSEPGQDN
ncbi:MAG: helix-turn-helix transcriptional regulator [Burkholderiales bacterium]|nr:helix-turn-helix transcriptional regulator [Burkholderiales bacterium]